MRKALYLGCTLGMKAAIYFLGGIDFRVRDYCHARGWEVALEYSDRVSASKVSRLGLESLLSDVRGGKVEVVVCARLVDLGRSMTHLARIFFELAAHDVGLVVTEQAVDTTVESADGWNFLVAMAEFGRETVQQRTKIGLNGARGRGVALGRRREVHPQQAEILARFKTDGGTYAALAKELGCSIGKAHYLARD